MAVGPSVSTVGQAAADYRGGVYLFVATGTKILWQRATTVPWPSQHWQHLTFATDTAPAAVQYRHRLYLFARDPANGGGIAYATYDGNAWSEWRRTSWRTPSSPAAASDGVKLHLFWRSSGNTLLMASLSGSDWSESRPVGGGRTTLVAPAAHYFDGDVNVFVVAPSGHVSYKPLARQAWVSVDANQRMDQMPVALAASHGNLFIFARQGGVTYYRIRERARADRTTMLPVDQWLPVERGRARSSVTAVGFQDTVHLFYGVNHAGSFLPGMAAPTAPYVFVQSATWSTARIAIVPLAKTDCSDGADTTDFVGLVEFADSVYSPHMIRMVLHRVNSHECNDLVWNLDNQFLTPGDDKSGRNEKFFQELDDIANRPTFDDQIVIFVTNKSGGGGFSGFPTEYVYHPEHVIPVCNAAGTASRSPYRNGFAHEIGHYAGLAHTFAAVTQDSGTYRVPYTLAEAQAAFQTAGYDVSVFDGDKGSLIAGLGVGDTPPDPLYEQNTVSDMKCAPADQPVILLDRRTVPAQHIVLIPPRLNLMSYYQVSPRLVNRLTPDQVKIVYHGLRTRGVIE